MKPKQFVVLAAIAAATSLLAILTWSANNEWSEVTLGGSKLLPVVSGDPDKTARIEIRNHDSVIELERAGKEWKVKNRDGYPAKAEDAIRLVRRLAAAERVEPKTRKADRYHLIGTQDVEAEGSAAKRIRLFDAAGKQIADVLVGRTRIDAFGAGKAGTYARIPGEDQAWLVSGELDPAMRVKDWVEDEVFELVATKMKRLELQVAGGEPVVVERSKRDDGSYGDAKFVGLPEGTKPKAGDGAADLMRAAGSIDLEDVRKLAATPVGEGISTITFAGVDGLNVTMRVRKDGEDHWLSLEASGEGEAAKSAQELTARTAGWEYKLNPSKPAKLVPDRAALFETTSG